MATLAQLRAALGEEMLAAGELARRLGVSRPTLSRLVREAGSSVLRFGAGRATTYALSQVIDGVGDSAAVRRITAAGKAVLVGELRPLAGRGHALLRPRGAPVLYEGLPPFLDDMRPQGFLGRRFAERHADLGLPARTQDWTAGQIFRALCLRGEDCIGDLILGDASFDRWLASPVTDVPRAAFPGAARAAAMGEVGSSAGGEHPKFTALSAGRHVLVKFADQDDGGAITARWRDLLVCEALALQTVAEAAVPAAKAEWLDVKGMRFLEVERFDRIGLRGRRGVISLGAWDNEFLGGPSRTWTSAATAMQQRKELSTEDARRVRWLDVFGDLIANGDRHFWNLSFFWDLSGRPALAPAYDMLPMSFAPGATGITDRPYIPASPTAQTLDVWPEAAEAAAAFWKRAAAERALSKSFRAIAAECSRILEEKRRMLSHL